MRGILQLLIILFSIYTFGQKDVPNSKDSDYLTRYPGSWITKYHQNNYNKYTIALGKERGNIPGKIYSLKNIKTIEGKITAIEYKLPDGSSQLQLHKNYENALKKDGYKILFNCYREDCNANGYSVATQLSEGRYIPEIRSGNAFLSYNSSYIVGEKEVNDKKVTIAVMTGYSESSPSAGTACRIDVIESAALDLSKVSVKDIESKIKRDGKIALYGIQFEFNSATIQSESTETLKIIAEFLKTNPKINVFVVGHTDNVGSYEKNLTLSQQRSEAVANKLAETYHISSSRLTPKGVAMVSPVSTNDTDEGRKQNRRVEIVKK